MSRKHPGEIAAGLAAFSHRDRVRIAKEAGRLRAEAMTELIRAAGRYSFEPRADAGQR